MMAPSLICAGATSGTKLFAPGTLTRISPVTGSTLTFWPAIGRGRPRVLLPGAPTWMSLVPLEELPLVSVAVAFAVKTPLLAKACDTELPSPDCESPKSQWIAGGPLHVSVAVAPSWVVAPSSRFTGLVLIGESVGGTGSNIAVSTAVLPSAHAAWTWPAASAPTTPAELPAGPLALAPNEPPCGWTA